MTRVVSRAIWVRMRDELALVARFTTQQDAELLRLRLEAEGFHVELEGTGSAGILPHMTNALGGVRVLVLKSQIEEAKRILQTPLPDGAVDAEPTQSEGDARAKRARNAAVLGIVFIPVVLTLYSLYLCATTDTSALSTQGKRYLNVAWAFNVLAFFVIAAIFYAQVPHS